MFISIVHLDISVKIWYACSMKQVISAKLKLQTTTEQCAALRTTQLACSVARHVGATYKGLWTKAKQNAKDRQNGRTRKRYKGLDQPPKYVSPTVEYQYGKDYSFKKEQQVSVLTLSGRVSLPYTGYDKHVALIQHGATIGAAKLWYDKPNKQFYLLVSLELEIADPTPQQHTHIVGVDVGIRYLAVTATTAGDCSFYCGKASVKKANHYARLRKRLQQKGTRFANGPGGARARRRPKSRGRPMRSTPNGALPSCTA
jgi:transposase